jgi:predicted esterase YcpF (UPF0227 family)
VKQFILAISGVVAPEIVPQIVPKIAPKIMNPVSQEASNPSLASPLELLQACLEQAQDPQQHPSAAAQFQALRSQMADQGTDPATLLLLDALWKEVLAARRSAAFWQQISDAEQNLSEQMAEHTIQTQKNYLRLVQEQ